MIAAAIINAAEMTARFADLAPAARQALRREADLIAEDLRAEADRNLSGAVLKERTGTLRASLRSRVADEPGLSILLSADTPYAAYQEYGFTGSESVRAHLSHRAKSFPVKAFTQKIDYPAHSYLRAAIAEIAPCVTTRLSDALKQGWRQ